MPEQSTPETAVNPVDSVTPDQIKQAIFDSIAIWERYDPVLRFDFQGLTDREPIKGDGMSVFSLGQNVDFVQDPSTRYFIEADILRGKVGNSASYDPCEQRDGSCVNTGKRPNDIGNLLVHELGHVLGLADLGTDGPSSYEMTMNPGSIRGDGNQKGERFRSTPALGDVMGLRKLYPCSCPMPEIFSP